MAPKYSPILWWPQENIHKIFVSPKILIFLEAPKNNEIQNFEPQKMTRAYVYLKIPISWFNIGPTPFHEKISNDILNIDTHIDDIVMKTDWYPALV